MYHKIQFSIITQFISIWPIDWPGVVAPDMILSEPGSDGNEGICCIPQSSSITEASPSDCLVSYPGHLLGWGDFHPSAEMQSVYSAVPAD